MCFSFSESLGDEYISKRLQGKIKTTRRQLAANNEPRHMRFFLSQNREQSGCFYRLCIAFSYRLVDRFFPLPDTCSVVAEYAKLKPRHHSSIMKTLYLAESTSLLALLGDVLGRGVY